VRGCQPAGDHILFDLQDAEGFWRPVPGSGSSCWFQAEFMAAEMMMDLFAGLPRLAPDGSINDDLELAVWLFPDHGPVRGRKCLGCARAGGTTMQESTASTRTKACAPLQRRPQNATLVVSLQMDIINDDLSWWSGFFPFLTFRGAERLAGGAQWAATPPVPPETLWSGGHSPPVKPSRRPRPWRFH
jgi:hypothetical protein